MNTFAYYSSTNFFEDQKPQSWFLWSVRGFCIILLCTYLIIEPVHYEYDIVATVIVSCLGTLILLTGIGALALGIINRKTMLLSPGIPSALPVFSQQNNNLCFLMSSLHLLPFFRIDLRFDFETSDIPPIRATISSGGSADRYPIFTPMQFPHRGNWRFQKATWVLYDVFDLWHFHHTQKYDDTHAIVPVSPPAGFDSPPPIINSCLRDGDSVADIQEARGDYYDIKRYHPSDGMRKIVWKIFARTGELLARHPEKTMTPEGRVLMAVCAQSIHDSGARLAINYSSYLIDAGLECSATCLGQLSGDPAKTPEALEKLLIETAWSSDHGVESSLAHLIDSLTVPTSHNQEHDTLISHIVIIGDFTTSKDGYTELLIKFGEKVTAKNLTPVFMIASPIPGESAQKRKRRFIQLIKRLFVQLKKDPMPYNGLNTFLEKASANRWEVFKIYP